MTGNGKAEESRAKRIEAALKDVGQDHLQRISDGSVKRHWAYPITSHVHANKIDDYEDLFDNVPI